MCVTNIFVIVYFYSLFLFLGITVVGLCSSNLKLLRTYILCI